MRYITCNYQGRLGNLMYEIAATIAAAWDNGMTPSFPINHNSYYNDIPAFTEYILPIVRKFHKHKNLRFNEFEERSDLEYSPIQVIDHTIIKGYFTSSLYFNKYRKEIIDLFLTNPSVNKWYNDLENEYLGSHKVSVHVRRTDYVTDYGWDLPIDYYKKAVELFPNSKFFIFSDDHEWCQNNLTFIKDKVFVMDKDYIEIQLIGKFDANIIANSTFSAWGAMLGDKNMDKKIVAPKNWCPTLHNPNIHEPHWILI